MEGHLVMSTKERKRMLVFERVKEKQLNMADAVKRLELSYRQLLRSYKRYVEDGAKGLVHRSRGRPSNRAKPPELKQKALELYRERLNGFGPTLAVEKLGEEGLMLDHETLRRWLIADGEWKKQRKYAKHRSWRERKAHFGELLQLDGSHHRWFGSQNPKACLINIVDDATGITLSIMAKEETTEAVMRTLRRWIELYGVPKALYTDRKSVYVTLREPTIEEQLAAKQPMTAFGRACEKLGIEIIRANSPQAKGRVERSHGVYQDRFVKELMFRGVTTIAGANKLLQNGFIDGLNGKFAKEPKSSENFHRPLQKKISLDEVFCFEQTRVLQNDWTLRHENRIYQVLEENRFLPRPGKRVLIRTFLDGSMELVYSGERLKFKVVEAVLSERIKPVKRGAIKWWRSSSGKPSGTHPWRRGWKRIGRETYI